MAVVNSSCMLCVWDRYLKRMLRMVNCKTEGYQSTGSNVTFARGENLPLRILR